MKMIPEVISARATEKGNGFVKDKLYTFKHHKNGLHRTVLGGLHGRPIEKFQSFDSGTPSQSTAHLWDGRNWDDAGTFEIEHMSTKLVPRGF